MGDVTTNSDTTTTIQEPVITTSSQTETTIDMESTKLSYLGVKDLKFSRSFETNLYEYTVPVETLTDVEIEYITVSPKATVEIEKSTDSKYIVNVFNGDNSSTYIIKLNLKSNHISEDKSGLSVIQSSIIAVILVLFGVLLLILSRRLGKE